MDVKLFFAVLPPADLGAQIESLGATIRRARRLRGRMIAAERLHNTLAPVHAPSPRQAIARAKEAAAAVQAPSFPVRFEWTQSFDLKDRKPFVLSGGDGLAPLRAFQGRLRKSLIRAGLQAPAGFTPHITLLWADRCVDEAPIAPLEWTVRDFALIASLQGQSRHIHLARWALNGGGLS